MNEIVIAENLFLVLSTIAPISILTVFIGCLVLIITNYLGYLNFNKRLCASKKSFPARIEYDKRWQELIHYSQDLSDSGQIPKALGDALIHDIISKGGGPISHNQKESIGNVADQKKESIND